jgi:hypothetical protein
MAHFAKLDGNNDVLAVHVVNNDILLVDGIESEQEGIDFLTELHGHSLWKQTSYNSTFRKNYCGIGFSYDPERDAFIPPKPHRSWILNEEICKWEAPEPFPTDGKFYTWNENHKAWEEVV